MATEVTTDGHAAFDAAIEVLDYAGLIDLLAERVEGLAIDYDDGNRRSAYWLRKAVEDLQHAGQRVRRAERLIVDQYTAPKKCAFCGAPDSKNRYRAITKVALEGGDYELCGECRRHPKTVHRSLSHIGYMDTVHGAALVDYMDRWHVEALVAHFGGYACATCGKGGRPGSLLLKMGDGTMKCGECRGKVD